MNYRLIQNSQNDIYNPVKTIFENRGIKNYKSYMNLSDDVLYDYRLLKNIDVARDCLLKHINQNSNIHIIVDSDCDGYTSASIIYKYIKLLSKETNVTYSIHQKKEHGISNDITLPEGISLLIIPDAGSNDIEKCKEISEKGIDIIIVDHHICDIENPYAIIVNNQNYDYPNKNLSGVGVSYKLLQALDEETWNCYADLFLDLVALGNIGDSMDLLSFETRRLVNKGLCKINNKLFKALIEKQSYSIGNTFNTTSVQFYIVPLINGLIRSGDYDEKDLMFRAFVETDEIFKYKKRGETEEIDESIYDRVARLCSNAKARQNKSKDSGIIKIKEDIEKHGWDKNKVIFCNVTNLLDEALTGVTAMKIAEIYNKPCLLLRKKKDQELIDSDDVLFGGSGRNIDNSPIESLKEFLSGLKIFESVTGHPNAFGLEIKKSNIEKAIELSNVALLDIDFSQYYDVDFIIDYNDLNFTFIKAIDEIKDFYATGFREPYIAIENVPVDRAKIKLIGKENNTLKIEDDNGLTYIKFKLTNNEPIRLWIDDSWNNNDELYINVIGKCSINNFGGLSTPQIVIQDYSIN